MAAAGVVGLLWLGAIAVRASEPRSSDAHIAPRLIALEHEMATLAINSERIVVRLAIQSPRMGEGSHKPGVRRPKLVIQRLRSRLYEVSQAPQRGIVRNGEPGHRRIGAIQVGDREYIPASFYPQAQDKRPWVCVAVGKRLGGLTNIVGVGPGSMIGRLRSEIARAKSGVELGEATVKGSLTSVFAIETSGTEIVHESEGSSGKTAIHRTVVEHPKISLHVYIEPDGLPVRIEAQESLIGRFEFDTTTEVLATGIRVQVHAPPKSETITLSELEQRAARETGTASQK